MKSPRIRYLLLSLTVILVGSVLAYHYWPHPQSEPEISFAFDEPAPENPHLAFLTPFRNVKPDVKYVGDLACKACHEEVHRSFHQHPMGLSATLASDSKLDDRYDAKTRPSFASPEGRAYRVESNEGKVVHSEIFSARDRH